MEDKNSSKKLIELFEKKLSNYSRGEIKDNCFYYSGNISITDLSEFFKEEISKIATFFWERGITNLNSNQALSPHLINIYCQNKGIATSIQKRISFNEVIKKYLDNIDSISDLSSRSPIVIVMGHIDHGKTTLLDTICDTKRQKKEKGGITQKISIHPATFQGNEMIFLDTPGHHIFLEMRERSASLADLVILVIAADDGIMPQTKEIIQHIKQSKIPVIVFINHKNPQVTYNEKNLIRIKTQIQKEGLVPEEWGGDTLIVSGNAKDKKNTDYLLENVLLLSEINQQKANFNRIADGIVVDSTINPRLGIVNTFLVQGGQLNVRDTLLIKGESGKVKLIFDQGGKSITKVLPGNSAQIIGLPFLAEIGEKFLVVEEKVGKEIVKKLERYKTELTNFDFNQILESPSEQEKNQLNLITLAESQDSLEALIKTVRNNSTSEFSLRIIYATFGNSNEFLLNLAKTTKSFLLIFNLEPNKDVQEQFKQNQIDYFQSGVIYKIEDKLKEIIQSKSRREKVEKILGSAEVRETFYFSKIGTIAGCKVTEGIINRNNQIKIMREGKVIFTGQIKSLEREKEKINEAKEGQECGIVLKNNFDFKTEDQIISYRLE